MTDGFDPWSRRLTPGVVPGGYLVRFVSHRQNRLVETRVLTSEAEAIASGPEDYEFAAQWVMDHPGDTIYGFMYDGDTGKCMHTIVVGGVDPD